MEFLLPFYNILPVYPIRAGLLEDAAPRLPTPPPATPPQKSPVEALRSSAAPRRAEDRREVEAATQRLVKPGDHPISSCLCVAQCPGYARHLFDGMSPSEECGIDDLPDELLQQILSLLSADEAVKTCVLSRRWRHLWKSTDILRVAYSTDRWKSSDEFKKFVNHLVLLRGISPLRELDLRFNARRYEDVVHDGGSDPYQCVMLWVMYAVMCRVQVLKIHNLDQIDIEVYKGMPLVSPHLTKIELSGIELKNCFLNFSSCPALKELYFTKNCGFDSVYEILSRSIQCLHIFHCQFGEYHRTDIYAPSLVTLLLEGFCGRTPFLGRMPSLVEASVRPHQDCDDSCSNSYSGNCEDEYCDGCHCRYEVSDDSESVLLGGLTEAENLKLIAGPNIFIFRSDLRWCPLFSKMKCLLLNEWCLASNFSALACILEHSPVLRKLTLKISKEYKSMVELETEENDNPLWKPAAISEHLKVVKVHCKEVDEGVYKIGKWLSTLDKKVIIKQRKQQPKRSH
ncbi:F-box protein At4g22280-like isoform X3 [Oryza sativa Japonica Group]|uniref:F-box protein At4g22280-like isoform X3 n=1 Tax=Oryza sativa subsp. japonica TaxID=39947 RepID=UPI00077535D4|nr:F-box protein At4g22280-like isoform X2 [Oryza sativa Japonica Group]